MIINDLEFFNSCDQESKKNEVFIRGGGSSSSQSSSSNIDGKTYTTLSVSNDDGCYYVELVGDEIIKHEGNGKFSYKRGGKYHASYEVHGYGNVSYSCVVG